MQMYMQWSKDDGSNLSSQILIILRLPSFDKLDLSQFQLYIEAQTINHCFVCSDFKNTIVIRDAAGKEKVFLIFNRLMIHTWLWKWSKTNLFDLYLKKMNTFGIHEPCIKLANNELIFEQYIKALNQGKYDIEVRNDDAIKRNQIFFDFMQQMFNQLDGFYLCEGCLLIDAIMEDQTRKLSAAECSVN